MPQARRRRNQGPTMTNSFNITLPNLSILDVILKPTPMSLSFLKTIFAFSFVLVILLSPSLFGDGLIFAAGVVPCGGSGEVACQFCHLAELGDNVVNFVLFVLAVPISSLLFAYAGFLYVVQGMREDSINKAKSILIGTVVGLVFALAAWIIVTTIVNNLIGDSRFRIVAHPRFECTTSQPLPPAPDPTGTPGPTTSTNAQCTYCAKSGLTCADCVSIPSGIALNANPCEGGASNCKVSSTIVNNVVSLNNNLQDEGVSLRLSETWPPTTDVHSNPCHYLGTCFDGNCSGPCNATQIKKFITAADQAGLRAMYEVKTSDERNALISQGVPASSIEPPLGDHISGPHFSVYKK